MASEDDDLGPPIEALATMQTPPSDGFLARIRRSIDRRVLTQDLSELSFTGSSLIVLEYLRLVFSKAEPAPPEEESDG